PSVRFLGALGYDGYSSTNTENGTNGPTGSFALFTWSQANALCAEYNTIGLYSRTNWRLAIRDELSSLHSHYGNMFNAKGWATYYYYWSATPNGSNYYYVLLRNGHVSNGPPSYQDYASCVSDS
ncbi:DUF1566 domain-containing protein, partial [Vibrio splendidus]|uniref:Lcl C-terminal domain-containing protein n=1 Tax=Vibrio splendidus TaxID=29497 RepID=UPI001112D3DD